MKNSAGTMLFKCLLLTLCMLHVSFAKDKNLLKNNINHSVRGDYIKEASKSGLYSCRPKIAFIVEASTKGGVQQFRGIYKDIVKRITSHLATLPYQPGDGEGMGPSFILVPFDTDSQLVDMNTVGKKTHEIEKLVDDFFESKECSQGSDLLEAYKIGSKEAYLMAKRKDHRGFAIILSNGVESDTSEEHLDMFDTIYKKNKEREITTMVIGLPDKDDFINYKVLKPIADRGDHPFFWTPISEEDIKDLAIKIVDHIAGESCTKG